MPAITTQRISDLLRDYYPDPSPQLLDQLSDYLDLLLKWNTRTNLTAIRDPEEIVRRHFGESLFTATRLPACHSLLDLGSGAGFPGIPIQLALPEICVTLAESQNKKASFLREVCGTCAYGRKYGQIALKPCRKTANLMWSPCGPWIIRLRLLIWHGKDSFQEELLLI